MEIQIFQSKKGTRVVTASNLYEALQLPAHQYNSKVKYWISDIYGFEDDIRPPQIMKDYSERVNQLSKRKDYYLSIELAKLITLNSDSRLKLTFARKFTELINPKKAANRFTKEQVKVVLELTKVMGLVSCQKSVEKGHLEAKGISMGKPSEWWKYRARILGYSANSLRQKMNEIGASYKGKNLLQMLIKTDKYEIIRMAVIDLFLALGNSESYAKDMGDLAKVFAAELKVEIRDDRKETMKLMPHNANRQLAEQIRMFSKHHYVEM